ncbi:MULTISPECIES: PorP/SprF family type IX secretion system membrane protein [unclassified Carboxylicivirga]|uniref:PorP/SprF family type IX secretion system membrane protein n=1 Tax=Carboxylicivirga TaxID=1628153 RepID=UPI003D350788
MHSRQFCLFCVLLMSLNIFAQGDGITTQYMNSQLMINPAYAGVRNAFSVHLLARQQWVGMEGAPATYSISMHTPLNDRMASLGASLLHYQSGPINHSEFSAMYSYMLRINHQLFLSLGLSAQCNYYHLGLSSLELIEENDPSFMHKFGNGVKPNFGVGVFLFSPHFYLGLSMPKVMNSRLKLKENDALVLESVHTAYLTSGYAFSINKSAYLKPSFVVRYRSQASPLGDMNIQFMYKNIFWLGTSYRTNDTMAALANIQLGEALSVCYSYDFAIGNSPRFGSGTHEVALVFDSHKLIKRNRDRQFRRKKVAKKEENKALHSIRYF